MANGSMLQTSQLSNEQTKPRFGMESEILHTHPSGKRLLQLAYEALPTRRLALQIRTLYQKVFNINQKNFKHLCIQNIRFSSIFHFHFGVFLSANLFKRSSFAIKSRIARITFSCIQFIAPLTCSYSYHGMPKHVMLVTIPVMAVYNPAAHPGLHHTGTLQTGG